MSSSSMKPQVSGSESSSGDQSENSIKLSNTRYLTISEFKNKVRVDIREYYFTDAGERKPGKKGISLSLDEWKEMVENMDKIENAIKQSTGEASE